MSLRLLPTTLLLLATILPVHAQEIERWNGLSTNPSLLNLQMEGIAKRAPDSVTTATSTAITSLPVGTGLRLRALLTPPTSGSYTLHIAGASNAALWLSSNASRFGKAHLAWHHETTTPEQWTKFATQASASVNLTAGIPYYLEAQVMSAAANGHIAIGWKVPGTSAVTLIPIQYLGILPADPADANGNNLPDAWETQTGLSASSISGARSEYADPDNDGITNFSEYLLTSGPLVKNTISNGLTRDTWQEIQGQSLDQLKAARSRFHFHPNASTHIPGIDETRPNIIEGMNYGARYRGFLVAPATGAYRLWIAGDDDAELWFADGTAKDPSTNAALTSRFGKQLLAYIRNSNGSYTSAHRDFDLLPSQRTRVLNLTAGQRYYIEVLHKNESIASNHISLVWQPPGQARVIVPASAFLSDVPEDADRDNDSLPDAWETSKGLSITDNGFTSAAEGQYGDHDDDGLNNLLEYQYKTNPTAADTDGDNIPDFYEIIYSLDPTNPADGYPAMVGDTNADGIGDALAFLLGLSPVLTDADGDGVADVNDAYPHDPSRSTSPIPNPSDTTKPIVAIIAPQGALYLTGP